MKKIFLFAVAIIMFSGIMAAQEPDLAVIAQARKVKADSLSIMLGKVYATQAAMNFSTPEDRTTLLLAFNEAMNLDQQDEQYQEGNAIASEFFKVAQDMKNRNGINMKRAAFAQAFMTRYNDTTVTVNMNEEARSINEDARRLINELTELNKDSLAALTQTQLIDIKNDSLSQNMGHFYGMQVQNKVKKQKFTEEQKTRLIEGFNNGINIDENNLPFVNGRSMGNEFLNMEKNIKKQLNLNLNKDLFRNAVVAVFSDPKVPTEEDFKAVNEEAQTYIKETQAFATENSAEALTQKGLGKKYIENQMEKDPQFIQSPSGLVYKILNPGNGKKFKETDKIKVMYKGTHVDGNTFDESKEPVSFAPNQVVPGFKEALLMMSPGAKMIAILPYNIAYGSRGAGQSIKPFETLVFEIETLGIDEGAAQAAQPAKDVNNTTTKATDAKKQPTKKSTKKSTGKKKTSKRK